MNEMNEKQNAQILLKSKEREIEKKKESIEDHKHKIEIYEKIERAVNLVRNGAKLIGTSPNLTDSMEKGIIPATGSLIAPIELATGIKAYFVGKPNPLMMRHAMKMLGCSREETAIVGDRMDTDIISNLQKEQ